jgi:hypothetical protein
LAESRAIDTPTQQGNTMNTTLPRTSVAIRFNAVLAAAFVTLVTLGAIDRLAASESAPPQLVQVAAAQRA